MYKWGTSDEQWQKIKIPMITGKNGQVGRGMVKKRINEKEKLPFPFSIP